MRCVTLKKHADTRTGQCVKSTLTLYTPFTRPSPGMGLGNKGTKSKSREQGNTNKIGSSHRTLEIILIWRNRETCSPEVLTCNKATKFPNAESIPRTDELP